MQKNSHDVGTYLLEKLSDLRTKFEFVGDVRGKGLMIGIELVTDKKSKTPMEKSDFEFIIEETKNLGVIFGRGGRCANVRSKKSQRKNHTIYKINNYVSFYRLFESSLQCV